MSPTRKLPDSLKLVRSKYDLLVRSIDTDSKTLLAKFQEIEKAAAAGTIDFKQTLQLMKVALQSHPKGSDRFPKIITTITAALSNLNRRISSPVLSSKGDYVEMGDGLKWATCNIGASKPEDSGDYFAWGETETHYTSLNPLAWKENAEGYWCETYKFNTQPVNVFTASKYCASDGKTELDLSDDTARVILKGNWRIPTEVEWRKLTDKDNFTWTLVNDNKVKGYIVTSKVKGYEGNKIFLPAASDFCTTCLRYQGELLRGSYWSSSLENKNKYQNSYYLCFTDSLFEVYSASRYIGMPIRPVSI